MGKSEEISQLHRDLAREFHLQHSAERLIRRLGQGTVRADHELRLDGKAAAAFAANVAEFHETTLSKPSAFSVNARRRAGRPPFQARAPRLRTLFLVGPLIADH